MSATAVRYSTELETQSCWSCGIPFAMPVNFTRMRRDDKRTFYCPNGHGAVFRETETERLRNQLVREQHALEQTQSALEDARRQVEQQKRFTRAARGQVTKIKNRVKNGVCPCCNRTFVNLQRHMNTKHPEWTPEQEEQAPHA